MSDARVEVGRLGAAHGVRGWVRVQSYTDPPRRLFEWQRWFVGDREMKVLEVRPQGDGFIALLEGITERNGASRLTGQMVLVSRELLPPAEGREHYRDDLVGFEARNVEGALLGQVDHFVDTPGNAVMVIKGVKEHWVPVSPQHLRSVDKGARSLIVDWPEDF
ncbi:MAG TPA: ribosome maturation factor RimM [Steroidobacteraceae bacterium]|nr:ribosome maturation factor RimM [Steroidobacteraceae bacterium]